MPKFIVVTGPDGAGKSTVCQGLKTLWNQRYGSNYCGEIAIWDFLLHEDTPYQSKKDLLMELPTLDHRLRMKLIMSLLKLAFNVRLRENLSLYIINGHWYKYAASELAYGVELDDIVKEVTDLPVPEHIFFLNVPPQITARRKNNAFTLYERGAIRSNTGDFIQFQALIGQQWERISKPCTPQWAYLSSTLSADQWIQQIDQDTRSMHVAENRGFTADAPHGIVLNPRANAGLSVKKWMRLIENPAARKLGLDQAPIFDRQTKQEDELADWIFGLAQTGARNFVAAGGDGTVNRVLNSLMRVRAKSYILSELKLGSIALGSSNDFHKPHDEPHRMSIAGFPSRLDFARAQKIDVLKLNAGTTTRYFIVNASIGATAQVAHTLNQNSAVVAFLKQRSMDLAAVLVGLATIWRFRPLTMTIDPDNLRLGPRQIYNCSIVKVPYFGGQMRYDSPYQPANGQFHVHMVSDISRWGAVKLMAGLLRGRFSGSNKTESTTAQQLRLCGSTPLSLECDGEMVECNEAEISILPRTLLVCP